MKQALLVGEHCERRRRWIVRSAGAFTRDHVGMSNDNAGEKPAHHKPEDS